jgi:hypothetical protein
LDNAALAICSHSGAWIQYCFSTEAKSLDSHLKSSDFKMLAINPNLKDTLWLLLPLGRWNQYAFPYFSC